MSVEDTVLKPRGFIPPGFIPTLVILFAAAFVTLQAAGVFARMRSQQSELESVLAALKNRQRWDSRQSYTPYDATTVPPNGANPVHNVPPVVETDGSQVD